MRRDRFLFSHEPMACTTAVYEATLEKCVAVFSAYPGIQAIYQYGGVSAPGISDLDLLLVFAPDTPPLNTHWRAHFNTTEQYLLLHSPAVITPALLADGSTITFLQGLRPLWGTAPAVNPLPLEADAFITRLIVLEHSLRLLVTITRQLEARLVKQRPLLCELHSIRYDLQLLGLEEAWQTPFLEPIRLLRQAWFERPSALRQNQLLALFQKAATVQQAILQAFQAWAASQNIAPTPIPTLVASHWSGVVFTNQSTHFSPWFPLLTAIPHAKSRERLMRLAQTNIGLPPSIVTLLQGDSLPEPWAALHAQRQDILRSYAQFQQRLGGGFGSLHTAPLPRKTL